MFIQCILCSAFGWKLENRVSVHSPDFGHLCCGKNKILLPQFPCLPNCLNSFFETTSIMSPKQKFFFQKYRTIKFRSCYGITAAKM